MWNYLFYIAYLKWKAPSEYVGIESFISEKLLEEDFSW
jgi:inositol 1,4,5-triphosphate receptor type 1/inositol 1,4,5-triphosphate receptor type 3